MTAPPAPAKAARSIITPPVGPLATTLTTLRWEKTRPPKPGSGSGRDTGEPANHFPFSRTLKWEELRTKACLFGLHSDLQVT